MTAASGGAKSLVPEEVLLLPPYYASAAAIERAVEVSEGNDEIPATKVSSCFSSPGWSGFLTVRDPSSPWRGGCFAFTIYFPDRYPFESPVIEMSGRWASHPFIVEEALNEEHGPPCAGDATSRYVVPFDSLYAATDAMRVSVMARALQHLHAVFSPQCWTPAFLQRVRTRGLAFESREAVLSQVDRAKAHRDVERCSVTQEVLLGKPYVDYLHNDVTRTFLLEWVRLTQGGKGEAVDLKAREASSWVTWYGREFLPQVLKLP